MAKYVIDIPDEVKWIQYIQQTGHGTINLKVESVSDLTPYTEPNGVKNNKVNLCDSCNYIYPECPSEKYDVMFGGGVGKDNICCCADYRAINEQEIREKVEKEVWEFATMLMRMHPDVAEDIYWSMNGGKGIGVAAEMTYQEAKTAYNAWNNRNICVGDEVIYDSRTKAVVLIPETKERYGTILTDDFATIVVSHDELEKTGIHFDDIAELLKKMREE